MKKTAYVHLASYWNYESQDVAGYGFVVLEATEDYPEPEFVYCDSGVCSGASHWIGGDLEAAKKGLLWAKHAGYDEIHLLSANDGVYKWAKNKWRTTTPLTIEYSQWIKAQIREMKKNKQMVSFLTVDARYYAPVQEAKAFAESAVFLYLHSLYLDSLYLDSCYPRQYQGGTYS